MSAYRDLRHLTSCPKREQLIVRPNWWALRGVPIQGKSTHRSRLLRILQALETSRTVSYVLDSRCRLLHCNPAWDDFAKSNGAPQLAAEAIIGVDVFAFIPEVLQNYYREAFLRSRSETVWEGSYECSSPKLFRKYRMRIHWLQTRDLFVITNPLIFQRSHRNPTKADATKYLQSTGLVTMCAHCRCSKRVDVPEQWDFVPDYLELKGQASLMVSHGFCPVCYAYFHFRPK
jgi:hypothetical protein